MFEAPDVLPADIDPWQVAGEIDWAAMEVIEG